MGSAAIKTLPFGNKVAGAPSQPSSDVHIFFSIISRSSECTGSGIVEFRASVLAAVIIWTTLSATRNQNLPVVKQRGAYAPLRRDHTSSRGKGSSGGIVQFRQERGPCKLRRAVNATRDQDATVRQQGGRELDRAVVMSPGCSERTGDRVEELCAGQVY